LNLSEQIPPIAHPTCTPSAERCFTKCRWCPQQDQYTDWKTGVKKYL